MTNQSGGDKNEKKGGINDMILGGIKSRSGKDTSKWINNLTSEGIEELVEASAAAAASQSAAVAPPSAAVLNQTQIKWVDKLFDFFQQYQVEFNRAVQSADLKVDSERPVITPELISRMQGSDKTFFSGRMHTRYWTLAVLGNLNGVEGYVIPSEHYIGFEKNRSKYTQFFEFIPVWDDELKWSFDNGSVGIEQLPALAKQIFGHLIKVTKGEVDDQQRFGFGLPAKTISTVVAAPKIDDSPSDFLLNHGGVFDEEPSGFPKAPASRSEASKQHYVAATGAAPVAQSEFEEKRPSEAATGSSPGIAEACDIFIRAIEKELQTLSKAGAKAFEDHDFSKVEVLMKRTSKMKGLRDQMLSTVKEWKKILQED